MRDSDEYAEGTVCQQYQRGYSVAGKIVRAATVVVSNGPGPAAAALDTGGGLTDSDGSEGAAAADNAGKEPRASRDAEVTVGEGGGGGVKLNLAKERAVQANRDQWGIEEALSPEL